MFLFTPSGSFWLPLAAPGCSCLLLAASGCFRLLWLLLAAPGCSWLLLAAPGCSWLLLAAPGCPWLPLAAPGCPWAAASGCTPGCSWPPWLKSQIFHTISRFLKMVHFLYQISTFSYFEGWGTSLGSWLLLAALLAALGCSWLLLAASG